MMEALIKQLEDLTIKYKELCEKNKALESKITLLKNCKTNYAFSPCISDLTTSEKKYPTLHYDKVRKYWWFVSKKNNLTYVLHKHTKKDLKHLEYETSIMVLRNNFPCRITTLKNGQTLYGYSEKIAYEIMKDIES